MQKCPFSIQVTIGQEGAIWPRLPLELGIGKDGKLHFLETWSAQLIHDEAVVPVGMTAEQRRAEWSKKLIQDAMLASRTVKLLDVSVDQKTGKYLPAKPIEEIDFRFQLREFLDKELVNPKLWQAVVVVEAEWLIRQARGQARQNWILNTGCILAADGEKWFSVIRQRISAFAPLGWITFRQLARGWGLTRDSDKKILRRWLQEEPWTQRGKGGRLRVQVCDDFCWWYVKQRAAAVAVKFCKQGVKLTPQGFQVQDGKLIGIEKSADEALAPRGQLYTKTVGQALEEIGEDLKKPEIAEEDLPFAGDEFVDPNGPPSSRERLAEEKRRMRIWKSNIKELPPEMFIISAGEARLKVACLQLRQQSLAQGKNGHVTISALAAKLGISRDTFYRHKAWVEFYHKWYLPKEHQRTIHDDKIGNSEDLKAQGVNVTAAPELDSRPDRLPKNYAEVAQPHLKVIRAYDEKIPDANGNTFTLAHLAAYLKGLEVDELWSLRKVMEEKGYSPIKLHEMGFPEPEKKKTKLIE